MFLQLWANLDRQDVWYELISRGRDSCRDCGWLQEMAKSEIDFKRVMKALLGYSLVESRQRTGSYSIHPVVHDWCAETISRGMDGLMMTAVKLVGAAVPDDAEAEYWVLQRRLMAHADRCARRIEDSGVLERVEPVEASDAFYNLGALYADQGKLVEAEVMYLRALNGYEKAWGHEHMLTLYTINNLGILYADQGKLIKAEGMYLRALHGKKKALGCEHMSTLNTVNSLGNLYRKQGKLVEAEELCQWAFDGFKKARGPDHASTLTIANNLHLIQSNQVEEERSEETFQQVLGGNEKTGA